MLVAHQEAVGSDARPEAVGCPELSVARGGAGRCCVPASCPAGASGAGPSHGRVRRGGGLQGIAQTLVFGKERGGQRVCWHIVPTDTARGQLQVAVIVSSLECLIQ